MDKLIKKLITDEPYLNIVLDYAPNVVIVPVILDKGSTENPELVGKLEYQISDGMAGKRSTSNNVYTWDDAKKMAKEMQNA